MLETTARDLRSLIHETVFLGGAATGLLLTDPAAPPIRITRDIDVIIEVAFSLKDQSIHATLS